MDRDISPRLVKMEKVIQGGATLILILVIGISFISVIAAFSVFVFFTLLNLLAVRSILRKVE